MCRPPPKPPDRQNSLNIKASKCIFPEIHYASKERVNYRPYSKVSDKSNRADENKRVVSYTKSKRRPPPKCARTLSLVYGQTLEITICQCVDAKQLSNPPKQSQ